jgi:CRP-like cAMP-binding protein
VASFTLAGMSHKIQTNSDTLAALADLDLLRGSLREDLARLCHDADLVNLPAGDVIDRAGTRARQMIGIVDGYIRGITADGDAVVLGPGEQFGAAELFDRRPHTMTYTAVTPAVVVAVFGPAFTAGVASIPGVVDAARLIADIRATARRELPMVASAR